MGHKFNPNSASIQKRKHIHSIYKQILYFLKFSILAQIFVALIFMGLVIFTCHFTTIWEHCICSVCSLFQHFLNFFNNSCFNFYWSKVDLQGCVCTSFFNSSRRTSAHWSSAGLLYSEQTSLSCTQLWRHISQGLLFHRPPQLFLMVLSKTHYIWTPSSVWILVSRSRVRRSFDPRPSASWRLTLPTFGVWDWTDSPRQGYPTGPGLQTRAVILRSDDLS